METIYLIRGSIGKFIKSFDMVIKAILKIGAYYLLFHYVSNIEGFAGQGLVNSLPAHLVLAVVSMLLPNRCGILLAILLGLYNISQVTVLGAGIAAVFFLVLYIMTSRLFPDHVYMLAIVPLVLHFKMYLLLPLIAGMYMGVVALIPMILGAVMAILMTLIPEFMNLQMPAGVDQLPQILSDIFKYGFNQILHNEELIFVAIIFTGVVVLVHLLHKMEINYGAYIAIIAGTVLGLVCMFMGKMTFGITDSYMGIIGRALLSFVIVVIAEFMHAALDYQSTQKLSFEDDEYQYYVTVIPKISVSKPKREVKNITEEPVRKPAESASGRKPVEPSAAVKRPERRPVENPTMPYQPVEQQPVHHSQEKRREIPGMPEGGVRIEKAPVKQTQKPVEPQKPAVKKESEKLLNSFFEED